MASSLVELTLARIRLFTREPEALFWAFGFPLLLTMALGIAFRNRPPDPVKVAVEEGPDARATFQALTATAEIHASQLSPEDAATALRTGKVALVVSGTNPVTYAFDETRPESRVARLVVDDALQRAGGRHDARQVSEKHVSEPGARYIDFLIPGLIGMNIMSAAMWGIGYVIVETRSKRLLKRMAATPMRRAEFLAAFVISRMMFVLIELPILLVFAYFAFGVRMHGSIALFSLLVLLGTFSFSGIGMLVASRTPSTQTASGLMNLVMMPMFICSGVFFSSSKFPDVVQPLIKLLPLTALNDSLRAVMNEGAGVSAVTGEAAVMGVMGLVSFTVALRWFRWQ